MVQTAMTASPANFTTSPPYWWTMSISCPKYSLRMLAIASTPAGPASARLSVRRVKPEMSAKRTAAWISSATGDSMGEGSAAIRFRISLGT
jgi:hypothetical protein